MKKTFNPEEWAEPQNQPVSQHTPQPKAQTGTPEDVARNEKSETGKYLKNIL